VNLSHKKVVKWAGEDAWLAGMYLCYGMLKNHNEGNLNVWFFLYPRPATVYFFVILFMSENFWACFTGA
jgi:hypothetical protein